MIPYSDTDILMKVTMHPNAGDKHAGNIVTLVKHKLVGVFTSTQLKSTCIIIEGGGVIQVQEPEDTILKNLMGNTAQGINEGEQ